MCFWKVAAYLCGVPDAVPYTNIQSTAIPALIIDHKQHDEEINDGKLPKDLIKEKRGCTIC